MWANSPSRPVPGEVWRSSSTDGRTPAIWTPGTRTCAQGRKSPSWCAPVPVPGFEWGHHQSYVILPPTCFRRGRQLRTGPPGRDALRAGRRGRDGPRARGGAPGGDRDVRAGPGPRSRRNPYLNVVPTITIMRIISRMCFIHDTRSIFLL